MNDTTTQCVLFPGFFKNAVVAMLDRDRGSSDGGTILLKALDEILASRRH